MKKLLFFLILILSFQLYSCKKKCQGKFKKSLTYLKEYINPDNRETRLVIEITHNIEVLESISGILNNDQGNFLGKMIVTQTDIDKWEKWLLVQCPNNKK